METPRAFVNVITVTISDRGFKTEFDGDVKKACSL
jgi:hypothetical protein